MDDASSNQNEPVLTDFVDPQLPQPEVQAIPIPPKIHWSWPDLLLVVVVSTILLVAGGFGVGVVLRLLHVTNVLTFATPIVLVLEAVVLIGSVYLLGLRRTRQTWAAIGIRRISLPWVFGALGLGVLAIPVGGLVRVLVLLLLRLPLTNPQLRVLAPASISWISISAAILLGGLVVPFAEELLFRGVIYNFLRERWGVWIGAFVSALAFAVAHLDVGVGALAFVLGLFCVFAYERSKSLWASVIVHATLNSIQLILLYTILASGVKIPGM